MDPILMIVYVLTIIGPKIAENVGEKITSDIYDNLKDSINKKILRKKNIDILEKYPDITKISKELLYKILKELKVEKDDHIVSSAKELMDIKISKLDTNDEISVEYVHITDHRLKDEVFAIELLKSPIRIEKDKAGLIDIIINRSGIEKAVITNQAKKKICDKYVKNKKQIAQNDNQYHEFLTNKSCNEKLEIDLDKFPLRWASGGVLSIINYKGETWTPFFFRDINPAGWNISLGASERHFENGKVITDLDKELNDPMRFILREFLEETLVLTKKPKGGPRNPSTAKRFCFELGKKKHRKDAVKFAHEHIVCRLRDDNLIININPLEAGHNDYNPDFDIDVDFLETNTVLHVVHKGKQSRIRNVLVCFNLLELGIEVVKVAKYKLDDDDYLLDGEILNHDNGTQELIRMPFALISHRYLEKEFGGNYKPIPPPDDVQPSIMGSPISPEDICIFNWDIDKRLEVLDGKRQGIGKEKERYELWRKNFHQNFLDKHGKPTNSNPSSLFTPASAKIIHSYFSNVLKS
jgi:hypothetical protein